MATLKQKRLAVLEDTVKHYRLGNRSVVTNEFYTENCTYIPNNPKKSEGCAVGRLVKDKRLLAKLDKTSNGIIGGDYDELPKYIQVLGSDFLNKLQVLHDEPAYWNTKGISKMGKVRVNELKEIFELV